MSTLPATEVEAVARVLAGEAGISLSGGLGAALRLAIADAAAARRQGPESLVRAVLARDPGALADLVDHAVVTETAFWRHPEQLAAVAALAAAREAPLRVWSAGCATGEEAYTLALVLQQAGRAGRGDLVVATDVSSRALERARAGRYAPRALRKLPAEAREAALEPAGPDGARRVRPALRRMVAFSRHNLVSDPPPAEAPFGIVVCRNVLIYFDPALAAAVLQRLAAALEPGGALVLGPVEVPLAAAAGLRPEVVQGGTVMRRT